jgi:hypothetical protein
MDGKSTSGCYCFVAIHVEKRTVSCIKEEDDLLYGNVVVVKTLTDNANLDFAKWQIMKWFEHTADGFLIVSVHTGEKLWSSDKKIYLSTGTGVLNTWKFQATSGKQCFLSLPLKNKQLSCDKLGQISISDNWKSCWEVWHLIQTGRKLHLHGIHCPSGVVSFPHK